MAQVTDELLRLYRAGKLTPTMMKSTLAAASAEMDVEREADRLRGIARQLRYVAAIANNERCLREWWRLMHADSWNEDGSGI